MKQSTKLSTVWKNHWETHSFLHMATQNAWELALSLPHHPHSLQNPCSDQTFNLELSATLRIPSKHHTSSQLLQLPRRKFQWMPRQFNALRSPKKERKKSTPNQKNHLQKRKSSDFDAWFDGKIKRRKCPFLTATEPTKKLKRVRKWKKNS